MEWTFHERKVKWHSIGAQQFYETDDEFRELGSEQTLDLTDDNLNTLEKGSGMPAYLDRHDGFFALLDEK